MKDLHIYRNQQIKFTNLITISLFLIEHVFAQYNEQIQENSQQCFNEIDKSTNDLKLKFENIKTKVERSLENFEEIKVIITESITDLDKSNQLTESNSQCFLENIQTQVKYLIDKLNTVNNDSLNVNVNNEEFKMDIINLEQNISRLLTEPRSMINFDLDESMIRILNKDNNIKCERKQILQPEQLINEIIYAILNTNYDKAVSLLNQISNDNDIYVIINEIYKNHIINRFDLLLNFASKIANSRKAMIVYDALCNELIKRNNNDNYKYLKLIKVINNHTDDAINRNELENNLKPLKSKLKRSSIEFLKSLLILNNTTDIELGFDLINQIYEIDLNLFEEIFKDFIILTKLQVKHNEVYRNLMKLIRSFGTKSQELLIEAINIGIAKSFDEINIDDLLKMCKEYRIKEDAYRNEVNLKVIQVIREMIKKLLSLSLFNIIFSDRHCIRNVGLDEYLSTGQETIGKSGYYEYDRDRRNVFTRARNESDGNKEWKIEYSGDNYYTIFNSNFSEYMYASIGKFIKHRRIIWLWVRGDKDKTADWIFEMTGDFVYIMSALNKEYLYGSCKDCKFHEWQQRHVYTLWKGNNNCLDNYCVWSIEDCT